jgi:hypothetical protein
MRSNAPKLRSNTISMDANALRCPKNLSFDDSTTIKKSSPNQQILVFGNKEVWLRNITPPL